MHRLNIDIKGLVIIVGNYGSGKTEVAVNLAIKRRRDGIDVRLADLDLVNPYFRTREAKKQLTSLAIDVVVPPAQYHSADLPILVPRISGLIRAPGQLTILDVGGDDVGATVLASLHDALRDSEPAVLQVINPYRPFTDTVDGCLKIKEAIEAAAKMKINGLIGNANLIEETEIGHIQEGYRFAQALAAESHLPLSFITAKSDFLGSLDQRAFSCPILPIERQLVPPWRKAVSLV